MKDIIKQDVVQRLLPLLNNEQIKALDHTLEVVLDKYLENKTDNDEISNLELLQKFLEAKRIEGCSERLWPTIRIQSIGCLRILERK